MSLDQGARKVAEQVEKTMQGLGDSSLWISMLQRHEIAHMYMYYCSMHPH